jgi:hypothetical protein
MRWIQGLINPWNMITSSNTNLTKTGGALRCSGGVSSSYCISQAHVYSEHKSWSEWGSGSTGFTLIDLFWLYSLRSIFFSLMTLYECSFISQFYWWRKPDQEKITDKLYHIMLIEYTSPWVWFELTALTITSPTCVVTIIRGIPIFVDTSIKPRNKGVVVVMVVQCMVVGFTTTYAISSYHHASRW